MSDDALPVQWCCKRCLPLVRARWVSLTEGIAVCDAHAKMLWKMGHHIITMGEQLEIFKAEDMEFYLFRGREQKRL